MRDKMLAWMNTYPRSPVKGDGTFANSDIAAMVTREVPSSLEAMLGDQAKRYRIVGSAGKGDWTHTPWVALLDPTETTSVEEGLYVVYLLSKGCERLYLTINQGCTSLKEEAGIPAARLELAARSTVMRNKVKPHRMSSAAPDLGADVWRAELYEAGSVYCIEYRADAMPSEYSINVDLREALDLYGQLLDAGGWRSADSLRSEIEAELGNEPLHQTKAYSRHRRIERNPRHSAVVKRVQGSRCRACETDLSARYGELAAGMIEAHHLLPLASMEEGQVATFDPVKDFAVLCPNCHRAIHRMRDPSDLDGLRALIKGL